MIDELEPTEGLKEALARRARHRSISPAEAMLVATRINLVSKLRRLEGTDDRCRSIVEELLNDTDRALMLEGAARWKAAAEIRQLAAVDDCGERR